MTKVVATMATTPDRAHHAALAFGTLHAQTDRRILYFNGGEVDMTPDLYRRLEALGVDIMFAPAGDLADAGKLWPPVDCEDLWLLVDDDLLYPRDYVDVIKSGIERHPGCIVTFHGCDLVRPFAAYYRSRSVYRCLGHVPNDRPVDVGGTGVMAFAPGIDPAIAEVWPYMADLLVARWSKSAQVPIVVLGHAGDWIVHQDIDHTKTIFNQFARNDKFQTWFAGRYVL